MASIRASAQACAPVVERARASISPKPTRSCANARAGPCARRASWARPTGSILDGWSARGWAAPRAPREGIEAAPDPDHPALRDLLMPRTIHVIGAGLAGLAAAVRLARARASASSCTRRRRRRAAAAAPTTIASTGLVIDNGNHLLLSGNHAALGLCADDRRASRAGRTADTADFAFIDLADGERWTLRHRRRPSAVVDASTPSGACPDTSVVDYLALAAAAVAPAGQDRLREHDRLHGPALRPARRIRCCWPRSTPIPPQGSAGARGARSSARRWLRGGRACRPLIARDGLSRRADRAGDRLSRAARRRRRGSSIELRALDLREAGSRRSISASDRSRSAPDDAVVLAVPPWIASSLVPGLAGADEFRAIVNAHFRFDAAARTFRR